MEYTTYRDGGTKKFTCKWFCWYFKEKNPEVCQTTDGEWYLGYPDKDRLLTQEEKSYVVPEIIKAVEADVTWRNRYLEQIKNPQKR
jgi:hypothetical protein